MIRSLLVVVFATALALVANPARSVEPVQIGTTAVFLDDQAAFLARWGRYIERHLQRPVRFVQRGSYREITNLLRADKLDFAWVCSPPYLRNRDRLVLAAVPLYHGQPLYQSYLIVPASDATTKGFSDLRGRIYAFSDPDSNSGWLAPQAELKRIGLDPAALFRKTFFTWAHKKVVEAVAAHLAQGGSVDGYVWETLAIVHPELTAKTRVVWKSPWYGFPPIVARKGLADGELRQFQAMLTGMNDDPEGRELLRMLNLDGFVLGDDRLFDGVERNLRFVGGT